MKRRRWPRLIPVLALAGGAGLLSWELQSQLSQPAGSQAWRVLPPNGAPPAAVVHNAESPTASVLTDWAPAAAAPPYASFQAVVERNLFAYDRRPPTEASAAVARAPAQVPDIVLVGIVVSDSRRMAVFRDVDGERRMTLKPGDRHQGWQLAEVGARTVWLQNEDRTVALSLNHARPNAARLNGARPVAEIPAGARRSAPPVPQGKPGDAPN